MFAIYFPFPKDAEELKKCNIYLFTVRKSKCWFKKHWFWKTKSFIGKTSVLA